MNKDIRNPLILSLVSIALSLAGLFGLSIAHGAEPDPDCETATHCVLVSFPRFYDDLDEDIEERSVRLLEIANSTDAATNDPAERAFLVMKAWKESRLARFVDLDLPRCREGRRGWCDSGKSFSVFQVRGISRDSTRTEAARHALRTFKRGANYCVGRGFGYWTGGVAQYARGGTHCEWSEAEDRVELMWKLHRRLQ